MKRFIIIFFIFCMILSSVCYSDNEYVSEVVTLYDQLMYRLGQIDAQFNPLADIFGFVYSSDNVCGYSNNGLHHTSNPVPVASGTDEHGKYTVLTCADCGNLFRCYAADLQQSYDSAVSEMPVNGIDSDGGFYWYPTWDDCSEVRITHTAGTGNSTKYDFKAGDTKEGYSFDSRSVSYQTSFSGVFDDRFVVTLVFPYNGSYGLVYSPKHFYSRVLSSGSISSSNTYYGNSSGSITYGSHTSGDVDKPTGSYNLLGRGNETCSGTWYLPVYKVILLDSISTSIYAPSTRITYIPITVGTVNGSGDITNVYDNSQIINEGNNLLYNPVTNNTYQIDNWRYNYTDMTIEGELDINGVLVPFVVTYGDNDLIINIDGDETSLKYIVEQPAPHEHHYIISSEDYQPPTCTDTGLAAYICSVCGDSYTEVVPALGHDYDFVESVIDDTETRYTFRCPDCGYEFEHPPNYYTADQAALMADTEVEHECNGETINEEVGVYLQEIQVPAAAYDLYRCSRCGDEFKEYKYINQDSDDTGNWAWLKNWLQKFKSWLGIKLDNTNTGETINNYDLDVSDNSENITNIYDYEITYTDQDGDQDTFSISKLFGKFRWVKDVFDIGKAMINVVSADAAAAYNLEIPGMVFEEAPALDGDEDPQLDGAGIMVNGAPYLELNFGNSSSQYFSSAGDVAFLDLSWYAPYKSTVDGILSGFLWLFFCWQLFSKAPGIISGSSMAPGKAEDIERGER